jgi:hypothetical protein
MNGEKECHMDAFDNRPCERKHRRPLTSGDASIVPLTLAFGVVAYQRVPAGCRGSPPVRRLVLALSGLP